MNIITEKKFCKKKKKKLKNRIRNGPYGLWTPDDSLHHVLTNLATVILVDVEGEHDLAQRWLTVLPVLTHHVLQVDGSWDAQRGQLLVPLIIILIIIFLRIPMRFTFKI